MSMKKIPIKQWSIEEANTFFELNFEPKYWEFLIKLISYKEIVFDKEQNLITAPSYIPIKDIIQEVSHEIKEGLINVSKCRICENYFDMDKEEGIFGDPQNLTRFICKRCSEALSAREFYEKHLKT